MTDPVRPTAKAAKAAGADAESRRSEPSEGHGRRRLRARRLAAAVGNAGITRERLADLTAAAVSAKPAR